MIAYYNEFDPFAAAWLRELIKAGAIAPGDVDERSIEDVRPSDLTGYTQCHFFAGIGVWSYTLRRAGWADDRPVWTGSCPCQPFSAAGKGGGFSDERHLWPAFHWLIEQCRPPVVLGEQVASKDGLAWLDLVQADLEGTGYASRAVDLCAAGVGAPHIRQRLWWVGERLADTRCEHGQRREEAEGRHSAIAAAERRQSAVYDQSCRISGGLDDDEPRLEGQRSGHRAALGHGQGAVRPASEAGESGGLADDLVLERQGGERAPRADDAEPGRVEGATAVAGHDQPGGVADLPGSGRREERSDAGRFHSRDRAEGRPAGFGAGGSDLRPGPTNGLWRDADWLFCRDGKWRPVEPGSFPLVARAAGSVGSGGDFSAQVDAPTAEARVGRLRGYGNAINAEAAVAFIEAYQDIERVRLTGVSLSSHLQQDDGVFG